MKSFENHLAVACRHFQSLPHIFDWTTFFSSWSRTPIIHISMEWSRSALWGALYSFVGRTLPLYKYGREWKNFKTCSSWAGEKPASQFWANKVQEESPKISLRASKTGNKLEISLLLSAVSENPNTYIAFVVSRQVQSFFRVQSMESMHRWCYNIVYRASYIVHRTLCIVYRTS